MTAKLNPGKGMLETLFNEMDAYYRHEVPHFDAEKSQWTGLEKVKEIFEAMDQYKKAHPGEPPYSLKAKLHETITERFEPKIFPHSPFFYEMGVRLAMNWGTPNSECHAGTWLFNQNYHLFSREEREWDIVSLRSEKKIDIFYHPVDFDHHSFGYTKVMTKGIQGVMDEALGCLKKCKTKREKEFINASLRSMSAVLKIAEKFALKAADMLKEETDPLAVRFLSMIAESARRIPKKPPRSFYEGLAMMWFLREVCASLESIGVSIIGHPDRLLGNLYRDDLKAGRITEEEAIDLVGRWYMPTDVKWDLLNNSWPETSTTMTLGGCDRDGTPVYNDVTKIMLKAHFKYNFMNPKLNCRFNSKSDPEYLQEIARQILAGHNVFALLNDDILIEANVKAGKKREDCRLYGAGGCQETVIEGVEHSAGAYYYYNLPKSLDFCLHPRPEFQDTFQALKILPPRIATCATFEDLYTTFINYIRDMIVQGAECRRKIGKAWPQVNPCPFFSASIDDCLEKRKDYSEGGGRYNPGGISLVGFGTLVESLYAIRRAVFEEKWLDLQELCAILGENWAGQEALRRKFINLPKYGHDNDEVDALAARVADDLQKICNSLTNEREGPFQPSFFVYYQFVRFAEQTLATPDGRKSGDMYAQGVAPGRLRPANSLTEAIHSLEKIDFSGYPGNAVLDVQLPMGGMSEEALSSYMRVFSKSKTPTLQCSCADVTTLKDAQAHPQNHQDLMVRISGLSAKFIALERDVQDEIISRNLMV